MKKLSNGHTGPIIYRLWAAEGEKGTKATLQPELALKIKVQAATLELCQPPARTARKILEKRLEESAQQLPVWPWVESVRGVGPLALALIVGEMGDLGNYSTNGKCNKRMGLAVINGEPQRKCKDKALAEAHAYNPRRRSLMWNVSECLMKQNKGKYRKRYDTRKAEKLAAGYTKMHAHNDAKRVMVKLFLKDLWVAWNHIDDENP